MTASRSWPPAPAVDTWTTKVTSALGLAAVIWVAVFPAVAPEPDDQATSVAAAAGGTGSKLTNALLDPARAAGIYSGVAHTHPATVTIKKGGSEVTVKDFDWIGKPFVNPIYYGARVWRWNTAGPFGHMVDFTHAKAIAKPDSVATFTGSHNGKPLPSKAPVKDVFRKLEFSHGHNMLTYNGLVRLGTWLGWIKPYVGVGAGISLPHSEVGFAGDNARTYEYHFAGFNGQGLVGLELDFGRTSLFLEYKFTYAPYDIPLTHEPQGAILPIDLWRQFGFWWRDEEPPGGRLTVNLASHHSIAGVMVKTGRPGVYVTGAGK